MSGTGFGMQDSNDPTQWYNGYRVSPTNQPPTSINGIEQQPGEEPMLGPNGQPMPYGGGFPGAIPTGDSSGNPLPLSQAQTDYLNDPNNRAGGPTSQADLDRLYAGAMGGPNQLTNADQINGYPNPEAGMGSQLPGGYDNQPGGLGSAPASGVGGAGGMTGNGYYGTYTNDAATINGAPNPEYGMGSQLPGGYGGQPGGLGSYPAAGVGGGAGMQGSGYYGMAPEGGSPVPVGTTTGGQPGPSYGTGSQPIGVNGQPISGNTQPQAQPSRPNVPTQPTQPGQQQPQQNQNQNYPEPQQQTMPPTPNPGQSLSLSMGTQPKLGTTLFDTYSQFLKDPSSVESNPMYAEMQRAGQQATERLMASKGYNQSGNMATELQKTGMGIAGQFLPQMASAYQQGAGTEQQRFGIGANAATSAFNAGTNLYNAQAQNQAANAIANANMQTNYQSQLGMKNALQNPTTAPVTTPPAVSAANPFNSYGQPATNYTQGGGQPTYANPQGSATGMAQYDQYGNLISGQAPQTDQYGNPVSGSGWFTNTTNNSAPIDTTPPAEQYYGDQGLMTNADMASYDYPQAQMY